MLSDSESELFITQSSFNGSTSIELSENNFESLFVGADNEKPVDNFKKQAYHKTLKGQFHNANEFGMSGLQSETSHQ